MIKFNDYNEIFTGQNNYDFLNLEKYENIYLNLNTDFKNEYNNELFILQNQDFMLSLMTLNLQSLKVNL